MARNGETNKYPGECFECGKDVPQGGGELRFNRITRKWGVRHRPRRVVMPTGPWDKFEAYETGGCPTEQGESR